MSPDASEEPARLPVLTAAELGQLARTSPAELSQYPVVVVLGTVTITPDLTCRGGARCTKATLVDAGGGFALRPQVTLAANSTGAFVMRFTSRLVSGQPIVDILGILATPSAGEITWSLDDLRSPTAFGDNALVAVDAWLVRNPFHPCPSPHVLSGYGCPTDDWLTPSPYQPLRSDGSSVEPNDGVIVQSGSYGTFAPDPSPFGPESVGVVPRRAIYVVRLVNLGCPDTGFCGGDIRRWQVIGRLDPVVGSRSIDGLESADPGPEVIRSSPLPLPSPFRETPRFRFPDPMRPCPSGYVCL